MIPDRASGPTVPRRKVTGAVPSGPLTNIAVLSNLPASEVLQQFISETPETFDYDPLGRRILSTVSTCTNSAWVLRT